MPTARDPTLLKARHSKKESHAFVDGFCWQDRKQIDVTLPHVQPMETSFLINGVVVFINGIAVFINGIVDFYRWYNCIVSSMA